MLSDLHHQLVVKGPRLLSYPLQLAPFQLKQSVLKLVLNSVFREALADGELDFLQGKWLKIEVFDLKLHWFLSNMAGELVVVESRAEADVTFSAGINELVLVAGRKEDPDTLFFQRRLSIEGDTELGLEIKNLLDAFDMDSLPQTANMALSHISEFVYRGSTAKLTFAP